MKEITKGAKIDLGGVSITVTNIAVVAFLGHWYTYIDYERDDSETTTEDRMRVDDFVIELERHGIKADRWAAKNA